MRIYSHYMAVNKERRKFVVNLFIINLCGIITLIIISVFLIADTINYLFIFYLISQFLIQ